MDHDSEVSLSQLPYILPRLQETCNPINFKPVIEAILFITISYTLITISTLSYRFRYYFKYYLLVLRLKKQKLNNILDNRQFAFDAFISCERKDAVWVKTNLLPMLENEKTRLKFCVAQRDFLVGSSIIDNIMNSINKSRKTIVVLSDHFFKSGWCMEELLISHHEGLSRGRNMVIAVFLPGVDMTDLPPRVSVLVRHITCIQWPLNQETQGLFWLQLHKAILDGNRDGFHVKPDLVV